MVLFQSNQDLFMQIGYLLFLSTLSRLDLSSLSDTIHDFRNWSSSATCLSYPEISLKYKILKIRISSSCCSRLSGHGRLILCFSYRSMKFQSIWIPFQNPALLYQTHLNYFPNYLQKQSILRCLKHQKSLCSCVNLVELGLPPSQPTQSFEDDKSVIHIECLPKVGMIVIFNLDQNLDLAGRPLFIIRVFGVRTILFNT